MIIRTSLFLDTLHAWNCKHITQQYFSCLLSSLSCWLLHHWFMALLFCISSWFTKITIITYRNNSVPQAKMFFLLLFLLVMFVLFLCIRLANYLLRISYENAETRKKSKLKAIIYFTLRLCQFMPHNSQKKIEELYLFAISTHTKKSLWMLQKGNSISIAEHIACCEHVKLFGKTCNFML